MEHQEQNLKRNLGIATTIFLIAQLFSHYRSQDENLTEDEKKNWKNSRTFFSVLFSISMVYLIYLQYTMKK